MALRNKNHAGLRAASSEDGPKLAPTKSSADNSSTHVNNTDLHATAITISSLTDILSRETGRPVVDKTGLSGVYDLHLQWTRETGPGKGDSGGTADAPLIFTALKEQLGLKLQSGKDPVQVLVIDQVNEPTAN